jgi:uncharacterized repeat protein (TIGR01451 family)
MKALYLLILVLVAAPVSAKEGFVLRWSYIGDKPFSSIAPIDAERTGYFDHVLAGSLDNRVYMFGPAGDMLGYYEAMSSITSVGSFIHEADMRFNDGMAGSLDDHLYVFWRPYKREYFRSTSYWWNRSLEDNVYAVGTFDYNGNGQSEGVLAGIGNYADKEYGKVYAYTRNGTLLWTYSTSSAVKILLSGDLDSDNVFTDVIVGAGQSLYVLSVAGSLIWKHDFNDAVSAISIADFDLDEEKDDMLVGAGNTVYALNSHNKIQWEKTFNESISGITSVDVDNDELIDYYLVSSGSSLYALKNDPQDTEVLWNHTLDHGIARHVSVDFDRDGIADDIVVFNKNVLYAYDFEYLYLPELVVTKTASQDTINVGDEVTIKIQFKNIGRGIVKSISYRDEVPTGLRFVDGNLSVQGIKISALSDTELSYKIAAQEAGSYTIPPVKVYYYDGYGKLYEAISNPLNLTVAEAEKEKEKEVADSVEGSPLIEIRRIISVEKVSLGENLSVVVSLINQGDAPALTVNFEDSLPPGFELTEGEAAWMGVLAPGEKKDIYYTLTLVGGVEYPGETVIFKAPLVFYRDASGEVYEAHGDETILKVHGSRIPLPIPAAGPLVLGVAILVGAAVYAYRRKRGEKKIDPELEEKFIQVYLKYQREGRRPTYQEMRDELGVELREIDAIVKRVKKKFGVGTVRGILSRISGLRK